MSKIQLIIIIIVLVSLSIGTFMLVAPNTKQSKGVITSVPQVTIPLSPIIQTSTATQPKPIRSGSTVTQQAGVQSADVDSVVQSYYNWYLACQNQHFSNANAGTINKSPQEDCPYNKTGAVTDTLETKLQQVVTSDPVLCAQNIPQKITFDKAVSTSDKTATAVIHTIWGASAPQSITIGLQLINNQWKINSINCGS